MSRKFLNLTGRDLTDHEREIGVEDLRPGPHHAVRRLLWSKPPGFDEEKIQRCRDVALIAWQEGADRVLVDGPDGWLNPLSYCFASFGVDVSFAFMISPEGQRMTRALIEGTVRSRCGV